MGEATGFRTYTEAIPDHDCDLDTRDMAEKLLYGDGVPTRRARFVGYFRKSFLVSRAHPYTQLYFKSTAAFTMEICRHVKTAPYIIHPCSIFQSNWEIVLFIYYILFFTGVPFIISYNAAEERDFNKLSTQELVIEFILMTLLLFTLSEIAFNFCTGYVSSDGLEIVLEKKRIAKKYLRTYFIIDLLTVIPYENVFRRTNLIDRNILGLEFLSCVKYFRVVCFIRYFNQAMKRWKIGYVAQRITFLIITVFLYLQFVACIILVTSQFTIYGQLKNVEVPKAEKDKTWAQKVELKDMDIWGTWRTCLLKAVYLTFGLYGQTTTAHTIDLITFIIFSTNSIFILAIIAVWVVVTTRRVQAGSHLYEDLQTQLLYYLDFKKVPRDLKQRILKYFRFCFEQSYYKESSILTFISGQLRQDVLLHKSRRLLETVEIFADLPPLLAVRLASCVRDMVVLENEVVMKAGWNEDLMYYILTGTVTVYNTAGEELCHLEEGDHFGEASLVLDDSQSEVSVVALETTQLWTLSRADFRYALTPDREFLDRAKKWALRRFHSDTAGETPLRGAQLMELVKHLRETHTAAVEEMRHTDTKKKSAKKFLEHMKSESDEPALPMQNRRSRGAGLLQSTIQSSDKSRASRPI